MVVFCYWNRHQEIINYFKGNMLGIKSPVEGWIGAHIRNIRVQMQAKDNYQNGRPNVIATLCSILLMSEWTESTLPGWQLHWMCVTQSPKNCWTFWIEFVGFYLYRNCVSTLLVFHPKRIARTLLLQYTLTVNILVL